MSERTFRDHHGNPVTVLGKSLGNGGEGYVLEVPGTGTVAKILLPKFRDRQREEKILTMALRPPPCALQKSPQGHPVLAWPGKALYKQSRRREFLGYTMPRVHGFSEIKDALSGHNRARSGLSNLLWDGQIRLARNLAHVMDVLHGHGYRLGDLNDQNVLVRLPSSVCIIDCDSMQVPRPVGGFYRSTVGRQEFTAPEIHKAGGPGAYAGDKLHADRFALGVLIFMLLMNKTLPYQARGKLVDGLDSIEDRIKVGHYPYANPRRHVCEPPPYAPPYDAIPPGVRSLFDRCFTAGNKNPLGRPSAAEWRDALAKADAHGYGRCRKNLSHVYSAHLVGCPWCKAPNDPYARRADRRRSRTARKAARRAQPWPPGRHPHPPLTRFADGLVDWFRRVMTT